MTISWQYIDEKQHNNMYLKVPLYDNYKKEKLICDILIPVDDESYIDKWILNEICFIISL